MSQTTTPISFSVSVSVTSAEASGLSTYASTCTPLASTHFVKFCTEVVAAVMMWASTSSRKPCIPSGWRMPSCPSTVKPRGMTCSTSRPCGMAMACAASSARSTSSCSMP
jgi:hypothetical protein